MPATWSRWSWRKATLPRQDAADLVQVEYEELTPVVDLDAAMKAATQLHPEAPGNLCVDWPGPVPDEQNDRDVAEIIAKRDACGESDRNQSAHGRCVAGDARRHGRVRRRERELHAVRLFAKR